MTDINEIKAMALAYGACGKASGITSIKEAIELLMTPQGREFAVRTGFPTLAMCRECRDEANAIPGAYVDTANLLMNSRDILAIGNTEVNVRYSEPDHLYKVVAMHGAKVNITATNYAVVTVSSYDSEVVVEHDGTALVFVEESKKKGGLE